MATTTVFYLAARSADKPPGKGAHERLGGEEDYTDLAREENWRRRLFALRQLQELAPADLALLRLTGSAELVVAGGQRCEALERARESAAAAEDVDEEASSADATAAEEVDEEEEEVDDDDAASSNAPDAAAASSNAPDDAASSNAPDDAASSNAPDDDASSNAPDDDASDDVASLIDLVAMDASEAAAEALAAAIAAEMMCTPVSQLAHRFGGQAPTEGSANDRFHFDAPPTIYVPAARLRVLYQLAAHDGRCLLVRWLHHTVRALEGDADACATWDEHATLIAVERGHRAALEVLLDAGCPADPSALCAAAARNDRGDVLRMLTEEYEVKWDERGVEAVVLGGAVFSRRQMMLRECLVANAPVRPRALRFAVRAGDLDACQLLHQHLTTCPALLAATAANEDWLALAAAAPPGGDPIGVLRWLTESTPPLLPICGGWTVSVAAAAARRRDPSVLAWLCARGCPLDPSVALAAAQSLRPDNLAICLHGGGGVNAAQAHQASVSSSATRSDDADDDEAEVQKREMDRAACIALLQPLLVAQQAFFAPRRRTAPPSNMRQWAAIKSAVGEVDRSSSSSSSAKRAKH
jgi:hypothetical protein